MAHDSKVSSTSKPKPKPKLKRKRVPATKPGRSSKAPRPPKKAAQEVTARSDDKKRKKKEHPSPPTGERKPSKQKRRDKSAGDRRQALSSDQPAKPRPSPSRQKKEEGRTVVRKQPRHSSLKEKKRPVRARSEDSPVEEDEETPEVFPQPLLVGTVCTEAGLRELHEKKIGAHLIEVRVDALFRQGIRLKAIRRHLEKRKHKVLLTTRIPEEGGEYTWRRGERLEVLFELLSHTDLIDVELVSMRELAPVLSELARTDIQTILSVHAIQRPATNDQLRGWVHEFLQHAAFCYKIAMRLQRQENLHQLVDVLLRNPHKRWALMGLGPDADRSREVLSGIGSALVYGYLDRPAAAGQPSAKQLIQRLGLRTG